MNFKTNNLVMKLPNNAPYIAYRICKEIGKWITRKIDESKRKK